MASRTMSHTIRKRPVQRIRKSYSLSSESVEFLETLRRARHARSVSSVLEEVLQTARCEEARTTLDRSVVDYYDSLSKEESREQVAWGKFASWEFPKEDP
jgi:hypothetical protein